MKTIRRTLAAALLLLAVGVLTGAVRRDLDPEELEARYATPPSAFLTLSDGTRMHYRDEGRYEAPPLLLIHGSFSSLFTWDAWVNELGDDLRIVRMDLPGHGLTGPSPGGGRTDGEIAHLLAELASELEIERFAVAGSSWGGGIALELAVRHSRRVDRLVLVDPSVYPSSVPAPASIRLGKIPVLGRLMLWVTPRGMVAGALRDAVGREDVITEASIDRYHELLLRRGNRRAALERISGMGGGHLVDRLDRVRAPALILWGEADSWIPVGDGYRLAAELPRARLRVFPGVGHLPMEEIPAESAAEARAFLFENRPD